MKNKSFIVILLVLGAVLIYFLFTQIVSIKPDINFVSFDCVDDGDCELVSVECCNNNAPTQNTCINKNYVSDWGKKLENFCTKAKLACPLYFVEGSYSCLCQRNRCWTNFTSQYDGIEIYTGAPKGK